LAVNLLPQTKIVSHVPILRMSGTNAETSEKGNVAERTNVVRAEIAIDEDRDTFLPRPSDDPNDPLNWPMYLKVSDPKF
jgi:hypothetical protein